MTRLRIYLFLVASVLAVTPSYAKSPNVSELYTDSTPPLSSSLQDEYRAFKSRFTGLGKDKKLPSDVLDSFEMIWIHYQLGINSAIIYNKRDKDYDELEKVFESWHSIIQDLENSLDSGALDELRQYIVLNTLQGLNETSDAVGYMPLRDLGFTCESLLSEALVHIVYRDIPAFKKSFIACYKGGLQTAPATVLFNCNRRICLSLEINGYTTYSLRLWEQLWNLMNERGEEEIAEKAATEGASSAFKASDYYAADLFLSKAALYCKHYSNKFFTASDFFFDATEMIQQILMLSNLHGLVKETDKREEALRAAQYSLDHSVKGRNGKDISMKNEFQSAIYSHLIAIEWSRKNYANAISLFEKVLSSSEHYSYAAHQNFLDCLLEVRDYEMAYEEAMGLLKYSESNYCPEHTLSGLYLALSMIAIVRRDIEAGREYASKSFSITCKDFNNRAAFLSSTRREALWRTEFCGILEWFSSIDYQLGDATNAYNAALFQKGILRKYQRLNSINITDTQDQEFIRLYQEYQRTKDEAVGAQLMYQYSRHPEFKEKIFVSVSSWEDVRDNLGGKDIAIEFSLISDTDSLGIIHSTPCDYVAILLRSDWDAPRMIKIGSESQIADWYREGSSTYSKNVLYDIWKPLLPYLKGIKNIYFSPYGFLNFLNIESASDSRGVPLSKRYNFYRVSSTGELHQKTNQEETNSIALFGGLQYAANYSHTIDTSNDKSATRGAYNYLSSIDPYLADASQIQELGGAKEEVIQISQIIGRSADTIRVFTDERGTEEAFKDLSGKSPAIIHLATHSEYREYNYEPEDFQELSLTGERYAVNPLNHCKILFSGAQHACQREPIPPGIEDGILYGEEICELDLSRTSLLVLSACQSGLGQINSDEIYGLSHCFKVAGVGTILMSLWEVDDLATQLLMTSFYSGLASGKSKRDSFLQAIEIVKKKYEEPYYWAAFIMLD